MRKRRQLVNQPSATVASPLRLMATPPVLRRAPPALGEHTDEVLAELGLDAATGGWTAPARRDLADELARRALVTR